jgi:hypothetical protein
MLSSGNSSGQMLNFKINKALECPSVMIVGRIAEAAVSGYWGAGRYVRPKRCGEWQRCFTSYFSENNGIRRL